MNEPAIIAELKNIHLAIGGRSILEDVSFDIHAGQSLGVAGPAEGGKTILLHICLGRLKPSQGESRVLGLPSARVGLQRGRIGFSPQIHRDRENPDRLGEEIVMDGVWPKTMIRQESRETSIRVQAALETTHAQSLAPQRWGEMTLAERWRLRLAQAIVNHPDLLVLDEFGSGLAIAARQDLLSLVAEIKKTAGMTTVYLTREASLIAPFIDQVVWLDKQVRYLGPPGELPEQYATASQPAEP